MSEISDVRKAFEGSLWRIESSLSRCVLRGIGLRLRAGVFCIRWDERMVKVGLACGKCGNCGKTVCRPRPADLAVCDCWEYCPLCGKKMEPFTPDLSPQSYESGDWDVVMICQEHTPPYKSRLKPVEVRLS